MKIHQLVAGAAVAALIPTFALAQTTCEQRATNRVVGTVAGAGIGALLGSAIAGHGDRTTGAVIGGVGGAELVETIRHKLNHLGGSLDPHACFLLHRGLKTLALRVRHQNESASRLASFLAAAPGVKQVNYPGLASHPRHARARELFSGFGGVLSFELEGGAEAASRFIDRVEIPRKTVSLGGVETLITRPALSSHSALDPEDLERLGLTASLIRVAVGIEDADDLLEDFEQALRE